MPGALGDFERLLAVENSRRIHSLSSRLSWACVAISCAKKTVGRSCWHPARRSVRLVQKSAVFQIRHHVANCRGAQRFFKPLGKWRATIPARRSRYTSDKVRQNLTVTPFLEQCVSHSRSHLESAISIVGTPSSPVNRRHKCRVRIATIPYSLFPAHRSPAHQSALSICARCSLSE